MHNLTLHPEAELSTESFCLCVGARHYCSGTICSSSCSTSEGKVVTLIWESDYLIIQVSWPLLGIPLTLNTVTALVAICAAVVIYAQVYLFGWCLIVVDVACFCWWWCRDVVVDIAACGIMILLLLFLSMMCKLITNNSATEPGVQPGEHEHVVMLLLVLLLVVSWSFSFCSCH